MSRLERLEVGDMTRSFDERGDFIHHRIRYKEGTQYFIFTTKVRFLRDKPEETLETYDGEPIPKELVFLPPLGSRSRSCLW
jgi:hypothetical protein